MSRKFKFFVNVGTVYTSFKELSHNTCSLFLFYCHQHLLEPLLVQGVISDSLHPEYLFQAILWIL